MFTLRHRDADLIRFVRMSVRSSPESTTNGALPRCWRRIWGEIILFKGGSEGSANADREPQSEFHAAQVAAALGVPLVAYGLARFKRRLCSTCPLFTSRRTSFVPLARLTPARTPPAPRPPRPEPARSRVLRPRHGGAAFGIPADMTVLRLRPVRRVPPEPSLIVRS